MKSLNSIENELRYFDTATASAGGELGTETLPAKAGRSRRSGSRAAILHDNTGNGPEG